MTRRPRRNRTPSLDFLADRDQAETVPCTTCNAAAGQTCTRPEPHTGHPVPLVNLPAHTARIQAATANTQEINKS
ncbi:hypothetical protein [Nocardia salmonicida]|uniref:zinc finger domain-containing protein n=1 Tax=Nocardia salmonicida TaxID=53431 RepID=UPI0037B807FF